MRVIKSGSGQKGWSVKTTCSGKGNGNGGCGAELLVEEADLYQTISSYYDGSKEYFTTFFCPECGIRTDLDHVPGDVVSRIAGKRNPSINPPIQEKGVPINFLLASGSQVKKDALQQAVNEFRLNAAVFSVKGVELGISEKPSGSVQVLMGAINRAVCAWQIDSREGIYFAIENGVEQIGETDSECAIILAFIPETREMQWVKSGTVPFDSDALRDAFQDLFNYLPTIL